MMRAPVKSTIVSMPLAAFTAGLGGMVAQIVLIRVLLEVYSGNELTTGIVLCNWMLITAAGAYIGARLAGRFTARPVPWILLFAAFMPLLAAWTINHLRNNIFETGVLLNFQSIFLTSLILLLPFCFLNGLLFPFCVEADANDNRRNSIARIFSAETIGSISGGLVFGVMLVSWTGNLLSLFIVCLLYITSSVIIIFLENRRWLTLIPLSSVTAFIILCLIYNPVQDARTALYPGQEIIAEKDSPYGNVVVTKQREQLSFFLSGELLFSTQNQMYDEECVHFNLLQRIFPQNVLIFSGNASGIRKEMLKYPKCRVDFVEENEWIINLEKEYTGLGEDSGFRIASGDSRLFLRKSSKVWDAIILNAAEPRTLQANRFFTYEFFLSAKEHLASQGVLSVSLPSSAQYLGREARELHSSIFVTLSQVFKNVTIIPGERDYFLASDGPFTFRIGERADSIGLGNLYVNSGYIDEFQLKERSSQIKKRIHLSASVNHDFTPLSSFLSLRYWLSMSESGYIAILVVIGVLLLIPLFISRPAGSSIWITGFTGASVEVLILLIYQAGYGHLYQITGLVFAVFMAGLALAALISGRIKRDPGKLFLMNHFFIAIYCLMLPMIFLLLRNSGAGDIVVHLCVLTATIIIAFLCGMQFILSPRYRATVSSKAAGILYGIDLLGAAAGALFISTLLIPSIGMLNVALCIASVNLITGIYLFLRRKNL